MLLRPCTCRRHQVGGSEVSLAPSCDDAPHREHSAMLKIPPRAAASQVFTGHRCRKRHPTGTGDCQAIPSAEGRCKQTMGSRVKTSNRQQESNVMARGRQTPTTPTRQQPLPHQPKQPRTVGQQIRGRAVSLETTSPRRLRRPQAPPSLVQELDWIFTQRPCAAGLSLPNGALNRGSDAEGAAAILPA
jgi:hypothetical protein